MSEPHRRKRQVLLVPSWYPSADAPLSGTFFRDQAEALHDIGYHVGVIAPSIVGTSAWLRKGRPDLGIDRNVENGVAVYRRRTIPALPRFSRRNALFWLRAGRSLYQAYVSDQGQPDLIHAHSALYGGLLAHQIARSHGIPFVITEHSSAFARGRPRRWMMKAAGAAFAAAASRLVVSPTLGALLTAQFADRFCPWQSVPNMLDARFEATLEDKPPREAGRTTYLCVGTLRPIKGQDVLISAFAERFRGQQSVRLRLVGAGREDARYRHLARSLGVADQVDMLGLLDRDAVRKEMLAADALVVPSYYETFGVVIIEALACGTPVIATRGSGPESIVDDGTGILVSPGDVGELAGALDTIREFAGNYQPERLRAACLARFSRNAVADQLEAVYAAILDADPAGHGTQPSSAPRIAATG